MDKSFDPEEALKNLSNIEKQKSLTLEKKLQKEGSLFVNDIETFRKYVITLATPL